MRVSGAASAELTRGISGLLLDLTARILKKDPRVTPIARRGPRRLKNRGLAGAQDQVA